MLVGVVLTEQVVNPPVPDSVHVPPGVKVTVPVGVLIVPTAVSVTVAVQVVGWPITTVDGLQATEVVVVLGLAVTLGDLELVACILSPL